MSDDMDRTEQPTARRLNQARDDGQVPRSIELPAAAVVIGSIMILLMLGPWMVAQLSALFANGFVFDRKTLDRPQMLPTVFGSQLGEGLLLIVPVMIFTVIAAILASGLTGGYHFSLGAVAPKFSKLSLSNGFKRMFGTQALVELSKALLKFTLVTTALWISVMHNMDALLALGRMNLEPALQSAGRMISESALWVAASLVAIAMIDVPYQKYAFMKRMRMTKQEVKDEFKQMEGSPEVKAQIRRRQREMANNRMMQRIKDADVIITNPEHFAVALEYDPTGDGAPVLVAKGTDLMAARIREEANTHGIHIFQAPPLARALFFTTEVEQQVPEDLYHAVAQVIAYVFSLEARMPGQPVHQKPKVQLPASMLFDANGKRADTARATA
jgi:flagellar biosynthetic protein FlhB